MYTMKKRGPYKPGTFYSATLDNRIWFYWTECTSTLSKASQYTVYFPRFFVNKICMGTYCAHGALELCFLAWFCVLHKCDCYIKLKLCQTVNANPEILFILNYIVN